MRLADLVRPSPSPRASRYRRRYWAGQAFENDIRGLLPTPGKVINSSIVADCSSALSRFAAGEMFALFKKPGTNELFEFRR
jgi:hypothetical protein